MKEWREGGGKEEKKEGRKEGKKEGRKERNAILQMFFSGPSSAY